MCYPMDIQWSLQRSPKNIHRSIWVICYQLPRKTIGLPTYTNTYRKTIISLTSIRKTYINVRHNSQNKTPFFGTQQFCLTPLPSSNRCVVSCAMHLIISLASAGEKPTCSRSASSAGSCGCGKSTGKATVLSGKCGKYHMKDGWISLSVLTLEAENAWKLGKVGWFVVIFQ